MHRSAPHHGRRVSNLRATCYLMPCSSITKRQKLPSPPSLVLPLPASPSRLRLPAGAKLRHGRRGSSFATEASCSRAQQRASHERLPVSSSGQQGAGKHRRRSNSRTAACSRGQEAMGHLWWRYDRLRVCLDAAVLVGRFLAAVTP